MTPFHCSRCQQTVFFENTHCEACKAWLGFIPEERRMASFDIDGDSGEWREVGAETPRRRPCFNRSAHNLCNWMVDAEAPADALCLSCSLTRLVPNLDNPQNLQRWGLIEQAKRRVIFTLLDLGLSPQPKQAADDKLGLAFHFIESTPEQGPVLTGHADGVITLNIDEADDLHREAARVALNEPTRTLIGHLRHEVAHYLQYRWITNTPAEARCREVFGDERVDYAAALQQHREQGPPTGWEQGFISAYASAHPWEDWAETCAHFLLVFDAVQTAAAWGLRLDGPSPASPRLDDSGDLPSPAELVLLHWLPVAQFLNAMNRSLGLRDSYPFLMPNAVLTKISTVQDLLLAARAESEQT